MRLEIAVCTTLLFAMTACDHHDERYDTPVGTRSDETTPPKARENGMCGGVAGSRCQPGLRCMMPYHPWRGVADEAGRCVK
jgi:hypothetical protein